MAGAIGAALGGLDAAIREVVARWVADRPAAGGLADVLQSHFQHLSDLCAGEEPCGFAFARKGRNRGPLPWSQIRPGDHGAARARSSRSRRAGWAVQIAAELDADPVRL